jgi:hypothetical protein
MAQKKISSLVIIKATEYSITNKICLQDYAASKQQLGRQSMKHAIWIPSSVPLPSSR